MTHVRCLQALCKLALPEGLAALKKESKAIYRAPFMSQSSCDSCHPAQQDVLHACSWVSLSIAWALVAGIISTFLPLWESRDVFMRAAGLAPARTGNSLPTSNPGKAQPQFKTAAADDSAHQGAANGAAKA